ncbi:uncharacterized protein LOC117117364 isoform X2 [Anneissia japonica]|nr:uncharacterized protein LOC117117364 isoform X2 [Anneissia japonica]
MAIVGAQCPSEFDCPKNAPWCYLIYPTSNDGWKYKDPHGVTYDASNNVYESPNCYEFIAVDEKEGTRSCIDAQQECEQLGGNITVINSIDECEQLTNNVLHILSIREDNTSSVHVKNLPNDISMGCTTIMIEDGYTINAINIINSDNTTTNTIVCESTGKLPNLTTTKPEMKAGPNLWIVAVIASSVVVTIATILLSLVLMRRRQRRKLGHDKVGYKEYVAEGVSEYAVVQYHKTTTDEVVYQDITEYLYHNTAAGKVVYDDSAVDVAYQNSDVDKSKRTGKRKGITHVTVGGQPSAPFNSQPLSQNDLDRHQKVTSSPDCVDIFYENSIRAPGSQEFQFNEDYSEIDAK